MTEADILAALVTYLEGKADGECVGIAWKHDRCPVARAIGRDRDASVVHGDIEWRDETGTYQMLKLDRKGELSRLIVAFDRCGQGQPITAATARRLLAEVTHAE